MIADQRLGPVGRGSHVVITFTFAANGSIAGGNYGFYLRHEYGNPVLAAAKDTLALGGLAVTDPGSPTTPGVLTVTLNRADTFQEPFDWYFTLERIDSGAEDVLASGVLTIAGSARA